MTVAELIDKLSKFDQSLPVYRYEDYDYASHFVPIDKVEYGNDGARYGYTSDALLPKIERVNLI